MKKESGKRESIGSFERGSCSDTRPANCPCFHFNPIVHMLRVADMPQFEAVSRKFELFGTTQVPPIETLKEKTA